MYNIVNTRNNKVITTVSKHKWDQDDMWQNRIRKHLTQAGFKFEVIEVA